MIKREKIFVAEDAKSDEQLVELIRGGGSELFARLYDRYYLKIYRIAYGMTAGHEAAEDLTQEIFLRAFQNLAQFSGRASFATWFHRLAVNHSINYCRRERKNLHHASTDEIELPYAGNKQVENNVNRQKMQEVIQKALSALKPELRMVVLLKDIENLSYEEIAQRLDCPVGTVGTWLNRGRLLLAKRLVNYRGKF